ncbi:MAG: hypothetical protein PHO10_06745 [Gemmiger sp.]|nr:hypothetical protein [Gemmiger sp.]
MEKTMVLKKFSKTFVCVLAFCLSMVLSSQLTTVYASSSAEIVPYAHRESLPTQYEVWTSYMQGTEYKNYVYRDFTYANGYTTTERYERMELTPLEYEFYSGAVRWHVSYSFY